MVVPLAFGWRDLLFANWPVDAGDIEPHIPDVFSVHEHDGHGWISIIPFLNVDVRPRGFPARIGRDLPELNVRTYVTYDGRPGVYFLSLDADGILSVLGARLTHHLPYYNARIRFRAGDDGVQVASRRRHPGERPASFVASYSPSGDRFRAESGSIAAFLTERRRLYTQGMDGGVRYTDVRHDRWPLHPAEWTVRENTLFEANGIGPPDAEPTLYYSPGVDVVTSRSKRGRRVGDRDRSPDEPR